MKLDTEQTFFNTQMYNLFFAKKKRTQLLTILLKFNHILLYPMQGKVKKKSCWCHRV